MQTPVLPTPDERESAARRGREEAHRLEEVLRQGERQALRHCLDRARELDAPVGGSGDLSRAARPTEGALVDRLRQDIERLAHYQAAVEGSRVWRAAQWARRMVRRSW